MWSAAVEIKEFRRCGIKIDRFRKSAAHGARKSGLAGKNYSGQSIRNTVILDNKNTNQITIKALSPVLVVCSENKIDEEYDEK